MKQIVTNGLGFEDIKANLKTFLRGQSEFDSYNFEGSAMTVLIDLLAYNTHYNMLYTNLAINESFIDSASKKASVISLAKALGYTAKSVTSARAIINIVVTPPPGSDDLKVLALSKDTIFLAGIGSSTYTFRPLTNYSAIKTFAGTFIFNNVEIIEGTTGSISYTVTNTSSYVIPNADIDTTTLEILVSDNSSSNVVRRFFPAASMLRATGTDHFFFIKQREDLLFEIYFGNGVLGVAPVPGNIVNIDYRISAGSKANGANNFIPHSTFSNPFVFDITTVQAARTGQEAEDIESIRFNAPRAFVAQDRAVTAIDYENILMQHYPNIESVRAWGGQDNNPPIYGKLFIAAKPHNRDFFNTIEKNSMLGSLLLRRGIVTVTPEFVDAGFLNIELLCNVYYNENIAAFSTGEIETNVRATIVNYSETLNKFDSVFRFSKLSALIDNSDTSISSNSMSLRIRVPVQPNFEINTGYSLVHNNPIVKLDNGGSFYTTRFYTNLTTDRCYIKDNGAGILQLYRENSLGAPFYIQDVGTINYNVGSWHVLALLITSLYDPFLEFVFTPLSNDVVSNKNLIAGIQNELLKVSAISDKIAAGIATGGANYTFTPR